ncbi:LysR family transcriptional regulator [Agrobacterium sp. S2]|nr:LysR family transcriptional regulator [Agrobacterium sp. S2]
MELRHLRYFLAVAEEEHFGRAAEKLHIVQPALSMQIRSMEDELGTPLFTRTSRKVELTEAGEILVAEARRTIGQAERAKELVIKSAKGELGSIRIGFSGNASFVGKLIDDLKLFHRQSPDVEIELHEMAPREQADAIFAGELDIGYCPTFDIDFHPDLNAMRIGSWPWLIAMNAEHPLVVRKEVHKVDLLNEPFVLYAGDGADNGQLELLRQVLGKEPDVSYKVGNTLAVLTIAAAGLALGFVPAPLASIALRGIEYRPLATPGRKANLVLISRRRETSGAVRKFIALAR